MEYSNYSNCTNSSDSNEQLRTAYYSANAIGVFGESVLLVAMLCIKAFKTPLQRFFIVVVVVMLVNNTCRLACIFYHTDRDDDSQDKACILLALVLQWGNWCVFLSLSVVVAFLLTMVYAYSQQNSVIVIKVRSSKALQILIEVGVNVGMLLAPWTFIWVPLIQDQYGFDGIICALVPSNSCTNSAEDRIVDIFYNNTPKAIFGIMSVVSAVGMTVVYCKMPVEMKDARRLIKRLTILMAILFVYFLMLYLQFFASLLTASATIFNVFWNLFFKFLFLFGYVVAFHCSPLHKQIRKLNKRISIGINVCKKDGIEEYGTFQDSSRESKPSSTYFIPSHTNDFVSK